jgi:hypothetical protein
MTTTKKLPDNQITVYQTPEGDINIEVLYANENVWLPQKRMAELFGCSADNISLHLKNIYKDKELDEAATTEDFSVVQTEGERKVTRTVKCYSLEAIIAVGYRVNSERGIEFRQWATSILQQYIHKGFAIDSDRFKYGSRFSTRYFDDLLEEIRDIRSSERMMYQKITDIYATAIDYSPKTEDTHKFFATVQNKLHFAITGQTFQEFFPPNPLQNHSSLASLYNSRILNSATSIASSKSCLSILIPKYSLSFSSGGIVEPAER